MIIRDIYIRPPGDQKYDPNKLEISDDYEMLYSKILMLLSTRQGEVLGEPTFGVSLEDRLFSFDIDEGSLKSEIYTQINTFVPESGRFDLKLEVKRFRGTVRDIILLDFFVDGRKSFGVMVQ